MRISDWSSDVCSSDLPILLILQSRGGEHCKIVSIAEFPPTKIQGICPCTKESLRGLVNHSWQPREMLRSEEHTSELQSLMRISYAVFCLKKKKNKTKKQQQQRTTNTRNKYAIT